MDKNETILKEAIQRRIENSGGLIPLTLLAQILPTLNSEIRNTIANNEKELFKFIKKCSNIFCIDSNKIVRYANTDEVQLVEGNKMKQGNKMKHEKNDVDDADKLPAKLTKADGVVIKVYPAYGFIQCKDPLKTSVYFTPACFGIENKTLLTDIDDLVMGRKVLFNAVLRKEDAYSKYRATKVWYPQKVEAGKSTSFNEEGWKGRKKNEQNNQSENPQPKARKTRETGLYDPIECEGDGKIIKLFPNYGFIMIDNDPKNCVFFYKDHICNYENVVDLTKVLKINDLVEFKAVRAAKQNIKSRWAATQVWIRKSENKKEGKSLPSKQSKSSADGWENEYLRDQKGKIFPHSSGTVIKFGKQYSQLADADSGLFYMLGAKVLDVSWEFSEGDDVSFDCVKIKSHPGWKAVLVWTGKRPNIVLPPELGDFSEYVDDDDGIPDSASVISKSSDNPRQATRDREFSRKPTSKSSGYSSLKNSHKAMRNSKSTVKGNIINDNDDLSDSASNYSKSSDNPRQAMHDREFSRKPTSKSSGYSSHKNSRETINNSKNTIKGNIVNDSDDLSDSASNYSKSSVSTSDTRSMHGRRSRNQRNAERNVFRSLVSKDPKVWVERPQKSNKPPKSHKPQVNSKFQKDVDNESVKSDSSKEKLTFLGIDEQDSPQYVDWGDSPYPDGEKASYSDNELYSSEDEFNGDTAPVVVEEQLQQLKEDDLEVEIETENKISNIAKIIRLQGIEGTVSKVYCKFAKLENSKLSSSVSFFLSDLYSKGVPVLEEGVEDLREILKEGDTLKFNCMVIKANETSYYKVTVVWLNVKPNIVEITPEQFMSQIGLSLPFVEESSDLNSVQTDVGVKSNEEESLNLKPAPKFFLSDSDSEEGEDDTAVHDGTSEILTIGENISDSLNRRNSEVLVTTEEVSNIPFSTDDSLVTETKAIDVNNKNALIDGISEIIKANGLTAHTEVDLNIVSSQILEFFLKSSNEALRLSSDKVTVTESNITVETSSPTKQISNMKNTESQTIFTGEVIGKAIFTQC